jgi:hypothetical protein
VSLGLFALHGERQLRCAPASAVSFEATDVLGVVSTKTLSIVVAR